MRVTCWTVAVATALGLGGAGHLAEIPAAWAQGDDAEARGLALAADGRFDEALGEFERAYAASGEPQLLYAMGRIHALRGDCVRARDHFERFLATQPGPKVADAAQAEIDKCTPTTTVRAQPPAPAAPVAPVPAVPRPPPPPPAPSRSLGGAIVHDRLVQLGAATGLVAGGLLVYGLSLSCWDGVCTGSYQDFEAGRARAPTVGIAAGVVGVTAGALVVTGIVRQVRRQRQGGGDLEVGLAPHAAGGVVVVGGRF
ncbi:MAG: hypothetical protein R3B06_20380 [Kofleriaceae bacterium]